MINYYQIIIIILLGLILFSYLEDKKIKEKMDIKNDLIEKTEEEKVLDLSVLENENRELLEDLSRENQKIFFSPGNSYTKQHILTNLYTHLIMPFH